MKQTARCLAQDVFGHEVPLVEFGPLRAFGSLRQLRDTVDGGADPERYPEDFTLAMAKTPAFDRDRKSRWTRSLQYLYQDRICNPEFKYTVEQAIGNPPLTNRGEIRDISSQNVKSYDMSVPRADLGESDVQRPSTAGCGLDDACSEDRAPTYEESSLYQFVYVTSSDDVDVPPGWHRLIEIKAWSAMACTANSDQVCGTYKSTSFTKQVSTSVQQDRLNQQLRDAQQEWGLGTHFTQAPFTTTDELEVSTYSDRARRLHDLVANATSLAPVGMRAQHRRQLVFWFLPMIGKAISSAQTYEKEVAAAQVKSYPVLQAMLNYGLDRQRAGAWRTGRDVLFATRCSDTLHKLLPNNPEVRCCSKSVNDATCLDESEYPYAGVPAEAQCTRRALEIADAPIDRPTSFYTDRLATPSPPPPSPLPPQIPMPGPPPITPPPPSPPVAITADALRAKLFEAQRAFCDSVSLNTQTHTKHECPLMHAVYVAGVHFVVGSAVHAVGDHDAGGVCL